MTDGSAAQQYIDVRDLPLFADEAPSMDTSGIGRDEAAALQVPRRRRYLTAPEPEYRRASQYEFVLDVEYVPEPPVGEHEVDTQLIAEWEGYVTEIGEVSFEARLRGILGEGVEDESEDATIPLDEISPSDRSLFCVGAIFRLCVSYERSRTRQVRRFTELVFRRLPKYSEKDLDAARARARERVSGFRLE